MGENLPWSLNSVTSFTGTECGIAVLPLLLITTLVILICTRHGRRIYVSIVTLPRDLRWVNFTNIGVALARFTRSLVHQTKLLTPRVSLQFFVELEGNLSLPSSSSLSLYKIIVKIDLSILWNTVMELFFFYFCFLTFRPDPLNRTRFCRPARPPISTSRFNLPSSHLT